MIESYRGLYENNKILLNFSVEKVTRFPHSNAVSLSVSYKVLNNEAHSSSFGHNWRVPKIEKL